ncbi:kinesin-related protein 4-like [Macrobrachium rosenbergii]|uniref:kinesin-related protein 4-like n=1 Tax=Macrobrachium rosenbergii TaxID=79674 RepID=UPI0034D487B7
MWREFHSSFSPFLGLPALVLLVHLRTTDGASIPGYCKVYHLTDNYAGSSTPLVPLPHNMVVYLYSDSPFWNHFSLRFTNWFEETTGMLSYQKSDEEEGQEDASGTFTLTGLLDAEDGGGSAKKYKEEVVKIPEGVFHLQRNVWINLTLGVVDNKLKLFFADYATIHFTVNAASFTKASVHSEQGQAISVTFNCMDSQNRTGATHSNSKTGLIIGLIILILAGLLITAYILRKWRNRQQSGSPGETQEQMGSNSKISTHNEPLESQSKCETHPLLKSKGEGDIEYSTENEVDIAEAISEVKKNDNEMAPTLKCPKNSDQTSKQTNENIIMTGLQETEKSSTVHDPLVVISMNSQGRVTLQMGTTKPELSVIPNSEDRKTNEDSALSSQGEDALRSERRGNQFGENSTSPLLKESSIPDELGVQKSHQEEALQQEADVNTIMQDNCSSKYASERATHGADNESNNYISEHQVRDGLTEKQQIGKEYTNETLSSTTTYQTAHSTYMDTDIKSTRKKRSDDEQDNLLDRSKSVVSHEMENFGTMVPNLPKSLQNPKQESQENQAEKEQCQEKMDPESKSSTEISHSTNIKETNASEIPLKSTRSPSKEDTFNRQEMIKRESAEKSKKNRKTKTKKTPKNSKTPKTHSPENQPPGAAGESAHLNKPVQDISLPVIENREDWRQMTPTTLKDSHKEQNPYKDATQSAVCGGVAPLQTRKPEENHKSHETATKTASLKVLSKNLVPTTHADPVNASIKSKSEPAAAKVNELNEAPQVNYQGDLLISDKANLSHADMQSQNVDILPRTEDNKIREGLDTTSNEQTDSESGKSLINISSHKVIQETNQDSNESNGKQVQCNNNYLHNATNQQLPYVSPTLPMPTLEERHFTQIQKTPRGLIIPSKCKSTNMARDTYPQAEHLHRAITKLEPPAELSQVKKSNLTNRNQSFIHTSSKCLHCHRHLYKILLQSLNTSGSHGGFEMKLTEELEFKLTKLNQSFPHKSSKWKNTHFHRDLRKKLMRKLPHRATGSILHEFNHMGMRSKKNRIRYLLYLKKCGCQVFVTSLRKKNIRRSENHHPTETDEIKLTKLNQSFLHKSSKWKNAHFHRDLHKKLMRKLPHRATVSILHEFNHKGTRSKKNRIQYLLYLKKYGCQVFETSLRKKNIRRENHHPMETDAIKEDKSSAIEVSNITNEMECNGAYEKGLPSSDEEML